MGQQSSTASGSGTHHHQQLPLLSVPSTAAASPADSLEQQPQQAEQQTPTEPAVSHPLADSTPATPSSLSRAASVASDSSFDVVSAVAAVRSASPSHLSCSADSEFSHLNEDGHAASPSVRSVSPSQHSNAESEFSHLNDERAVSPASSQQFQAISPISSASPLPLSRWSSGSSQLDLAASMLSRESSGLSFSDEQRYSIAPPRLTSTPSPSPRTKAFWETGEWTTASEEDEAVFESTYLPIISERDYEQEYADAIQDDSEADDLYSDKEDLALLADLRASSELHVRLRHQSQLGTRVTYKSQRTRKLTRIENAVELRAHRAEKAARKAAAATVSQVPDVKPLECHSYCRNLKTCWLPEEKAAPSIEQNNVEQSAYLKQRQAAKSAAVTQHKALIHEHDHPTVFDRKRTSHRAEKKSLAHPSNMLFHNGSKATDFDAAARARFLPQVLSQLESHGCVVDSVTERRSSDDHHQHSRLSHYSCACPRFNPFMNSSRPNSLIEYAQYVHFRTDAYTPLYASPLVRLHGSLDQLPYDHPITIMLVMRSLATTKNHRVAAIEFTKQKKSISRSEQRKAAMKQEKKHQRALVQAQRVDWEDYRDGLTNNIYDARDRNVHSRWHEHPRDLPFSSQANDVCLTLFEQPEFEDIVRMDQAQEMQRLYQEYNQGVEQYERMEGVIAAQEKADRLAEEEAYELATRAEEFEEDCHEDQYFHWSIDDGWEADPSSCLIDRAGLDHSLSTKPASKQELLRGENGRRGKASKKERKEMALIFNQRRHDMKTELVKSKPQVEKVEKKKSEKAVLIGRKPRGNIPRKQNSCSAPAPQLPANAFVNRSFKSKSDRIDVKDVIQTMTERAVEVATGAARIGVGHRRAPHPSAFRPSKRHYFKERRMKWNCGMTLGPQLPFEISRSNILEFQRAFHALYRTQIEQAFHSVPNGLRILSIKAYEEAEVTHVNGKRPWLNELHSMKFFTALLRRMNDQQQGNFKTTEIDMRFSIPGSCAMARGPANNSYDGASAPSARFTAQYRRRTVLGTLKKEDTLNENSELRPWPCQVHSDSVCQRTCQLHLGRTPVQMFSAKNLPSMLARLPASPQRVTVASGRDVMGQPHLHTPSFVTPAAENFRVQSFRHPKIVVSAVLNGEQSRDQPAYYPRYKRGYRWLPWSWQYRNRSGKRARYQHIVGTWRWAQHHREKRADPAQWKANYARSYGEPTGPAVATEGRDDIVNSLTVLPALEIEYEVVADQQTVKPRDLTRKSIQRELKRAMRLKEIRSKKQTRKYTEKNRSASMSQQREQSYISKDHLSPLNPLPQQSRPEYYTDVYIELTRLHRIREAKERREMDVQDRENKLLAQRTFIRQHHDPLDASSLHFPSNTEVGTWPGTERMVYMKLEQASRLPTLTPEVKMKNVQLLGRREQSGRRGKATRKEKKALRVLYNERQYAEEQKASAPNHVADMEEDLAEDALALRPRHLSRGAMKREYRLALREQERRSEKQAKKRSRKSNRIEIASQRATAPSPRYLNVGSAEDRIDEGRRWVFYEKLVAQDKSWKESEWKEYLESQEEKHYAECQALIKAREEEEKQENAAELAALWELQVEEATAAASTVEQLESSASVDKIQVEIDSGFCEAPSSEHLLRDADAAVTEEDHTARTAFDVLASASTSPETVPCELTYATTEDDDSPDEPAQLCDSGLYEQDWISDAEEAASTEDEYADYCADRGDDVALCFDDTVGPHRRTPFVHTNHHRLIRSAAEKELQSSSTCKAPSKDTREHKHTGSRRGANKKVTHRQDARSHRETR
jgi:hypothetical protein